MYWWVWTFREDSGIMQSIIPPYVCEWDQWKDLSSLCYSIFSNLLNFLARVLLQSDTVAVSGWNSNFHFTMHIYDCYDPKSLQYTLRRERKEGGGGLFAFWLTAHFSICLKMPAYSLLPSTRDQINQRIWHFCWHSFWTSAVSYVHPYLRDTESGLCWSLLLICTI